MTVPDYDDFYVALWPRLVRTAYAVSGDLGVAEDAVQTAFAKAYRSWRRISRLESPEAYVRKMAVNEVLNTRRTGARRGARSSSAELPDARGCRAPDDAARARRDVAGGLVAAAAAAGRARAALLRGPQRAADRRRARLPPGTVKSQASAALATLRTRLDHPTSRREGLS